MRNIIGRGQAWSKIILHQMTVYTAALKLNLAATNMRTSNFSCHVVIIQKGALERLRLKLQYVITLSKLSPRPKYRLKKMRLAICYNPRYKQGANIFFDKVMTILRYLGEKPYKTTRRDFR